MGKWEFRDFPLTWKADFLAVGVIRDARSNGTRISGTGYFSRVLHPVTQKTRTRYPGNLIPIPFDRACLKMVMGQISARTPEDNLFYGEKVAKILKKNENFRKIF